MTLNVAHSATSGHAHPFNQRIEEAPKPSKMYINNVIMDYLVNEGFQQSALKFAKEANIQQHVGDTEYISERVEIRNAILAGDIQTAIDKINDLSPDLLDLDPALHFSLLRLQLVELIRTCTQPQSSNGSAPSNPDITPALEFASTHLAPRAPTNPEFLQDLERTMALLIFPSDKLTKPLKGLLDPELRQQIATRVNEAINESLGFKSQSGLRGLVRLRAWAERRARECRKDIPSRLDVWGGDTAEASDLNGATGQAPLSAERTSVRGRQDVVMSGANVTDASGAGEPMTY